MVCATCRTKKDKALTYKRCKTCKGWCELEPQEKAKVAKRAR